MKKIVVGNVEIEVLALTPFVYSQGKGEKVLRIEVDATVADFGQLRAALEGAPEPVQFWEDEAMACEYVGYGIFEAQYKEGKYFVELHKTSMDEQMSALLVANEKLNKANAALTKAAEALATQNEHLLEQNALHDATLAEVLEVLLPATLEELWSIVWDHDVRLSAMEILKTPEETETAAAAEGDTVTE